MWGIDTWDAIYDKEGHASSECHEKAFRGHTFLYSVSLPCPPFLTFRSSPLALKLKLNCWEFQEKTATWMHLRLSNICFFRHAKGTHIFSKHQHAPTISVYKFIHFSHCIVTTGISCRQFKAATWASKLEVLARMTPGIRDFVPDDVSPQEWWQSGPDIISWYMYALHI